MPVQNEFLRALVNSITRQKANEAVIRGAWHLAVRSKDIAAMADIAGAANLPEDVLTAAKNRVEIPVAVAYLTREGVSPEERKARLMAENRAGVLAGVLESNSVTDADREVLSAKLIGKPTRALAEATIADLAMPLDAVVVAIAQLDPRYDQLTDGLRTAMRKQVGRCAEDADAANAVSSVLTEESLAERFIARHPQIDAARFEDVFRRTMVPKIERCIDRNRNYVNIFTINESVKRTIGEKGEYHSDVVLKIMRELLDSEELSKVWTEAVGATRAMADTAEVSDHSAKVLAARESSDTEYLETLLDEALTENGALVEPLLRNMALTQAQLARLAANIDDRTTARMPEFRPGDENAAMIAYLTCFDRVSSSDNWKSFKDRRQAEIQVLNHHVDRWNNEGGGWYHGPGSVLMSLCNSMQNSDLLGDIPWRFYTEIALRHSIDRLTVTVNALQQEHLGDDPRKWETAQVLSEGFSGSIRELMQAAAAL